MTPGRRLGCVMESMDAQQTAELYQQHAAGLIAYATVLVGPSSAEDLVADAMIRLLDRPNLGRLGSPRAYLYRCVLNQARSQGRREQARRRRERRFSGRPLVASAPVVSDELGALARLSSRERAVIYLTYWEDLAVADVAEYLGLADGSVRRYLARARTKLREELSHERA